MTSVAEPRIEPARPAARRPRHPFFRPRTVAWLRTLSMVAFAVAVGGALVGFLADDSMSLAIAGVAVSVGFLTSDFVRADRQPLSPATLMAVAGLLMSAAHVVALLVQYGPQRPAYYPYAIDEHLPLALKIAFVGIVLPILAFRWVTTLPAGLALVAPLPKVVGRLPMRSLVPTLVGAAALGMVLNYTRALSALGTITALMYGLPHVAAFVLARVGAAHQWRRATAAGLLVAVAESGRALWFAYLRSDVIAPLFAYAAGILLGTKSLRSLRRIEFVPVYIGAILFAVYFAAFAEARGTSGVGLERLTSIQTVQQQLVVEQEQSRQSLLSRLSTHNQLTQVVRITKEDGYLDGETFEYLAYAFVPRFLWPEKPLIAKGSWFALRIGQARIDKGRITNAVNMTIPGEFYLNFGWLGVILGTAFFGAALGAFWSRTMFWSDSRNVLGGALGYYLFWVGFTGAADFQIVVTLIAAYMLFVAVGFVLQSDQSSGGQRGTAPGRRVQP